MRPFQLLSAIAVFIGLETVEAAAYWNCNGTPIPDDKVRDAVNLAFYYAPGSFHDYPSVSSARYRGAGRKQVRQFPLTTSIGNWQGGEVDFYILTNIDASFLEVFSSKGTGHKCTYFEG
ncbi:BgTH12-02594 [Blumeria graminis f. sp. triticale]|uniref:BgtE-5842 n=3 Tax=Blumeria graminis TaxID=34373 RepID=A0A1L5JEE6_BLUGR|nr:BgtE-5842_p [Blumeria graminis f. sp. tritici]CAD6502920.1 BgTH12-02594 [Blumeria graminis f. sp. triticale]VDB88751.1 BgtE-5842 [Blumeria graminis f. sp. tritici]